MKILTNENASDILGGESLKEFVSRLSNRPCRLGRYAIPVDSGGKACLAKSFAYLFLRQPTVYMIYVSDWSMWPNSEHLDLFYGYRRSFGEHRILMEAPVHLFEWSEEDTFISILCLVLYFFWDAYVFDIEGKTLVRINHHEWLEVRTEDNEVFEEFALEMQRYCQPLLGTETVSPK